MKPAMLGVDSPFKHPTREAWLEAAVLLLQNTTALADALIPRVTCGFPSRGALGARKKRLGECWKPSASEDASRSQVFITPLLDDPMRVLDVLVHELGHVKHPDAKHGREFKRYMTLVDLEGKATATVAGPQLTAVLTKHAVTLGPYPHSRINPADAAEKKQGTRLLKATCPACECTIRITAKWAGEEGNLLPFCGFCGLPGNPDSFERMKLSE